MQHAVEGDGAGGFGVMDRFADADGTNFAVGERAIAGCVGLGLILERQDGSLHGSDLSREGWTLDPRRLQPSRVVSFVDIASCQRAGSTRVDVARRLTSLRLVDSDASIADVYTMSTAVRKKNAKNVFTAYLSTSDHRRLEVGPGEERKMATRKQMNIRITQEAEQLLDALVERMRAVLGIEVTRTDVIHAGLNELAKRYPEQTATPTPAPSPTSRTRARKPTPANTETAQPEDSPVPESEPDAPTPTPEPGAANPKRTRGKKK